MRIDGMGLREGPSITNLVVASGENFPNLPDIGELFFNTSVGQLFGLHLYSGSAWEKVGTQAIDDQLTAIANTTPTSDSLVYFTSATSAAVSPITPFGRSLIDDLDQTAARSTLGLGSAATANIGNSGGTVPLLAGTNTWGGNQALKLPAGNGFFYFDKASSTSLAGAGFRNEASVLRWYLATLGQTQDDLALIRYDDSGNVLDSVFTISGVSGDVSFTKPISASNLLVGENNVYHSGNLSFGTGLTFSGGVLSASNSGTVTSVNVTVGAGLIVTSTPVTTSGTINIDLSVNLQSWSGINPSSKANADSPDFTGIPTAPTAASGTNTTQIATTAFVQTAISTVGGGGGSSFALIVVSGNSQEMVKDTHYVFAHSTTQTTATLPLSPSPSDSIIISNFTGRADLVLDRNGSNIMQLANNLTIDTDKTTITLKFINADLGWVIV